jgi:hypothetical protein
MSDVSVAPPADAGTPWQVTLAAEFSACADALTARMSSASLGDSELAALLGQRAAYQSAAADLRAAAVDSLLAAAPQIAKSLADATAAARGGVTAIKDIAAAVGFATALLGLATAIGTAVATGNPAGLVSAVNGVMNAARTAG